MAFPRKPLGREEALLKMADLCARSEQCAFEIMRKLRLKGLSSHDAGFVVDELIERRFIDECRYARSFSRDKVRFSAWGRLKIRAALLARRIPDSVISEAFGEVDPEDYADAATRAARAKAASLDLSLPQERLKLYRHLMSRGFESDVARVTIEKLRNQ